MLGAVFALALGLSVVGLLVGPALVHWARGRALMEAALDGITLGLIPALVVVRVLPHLAAEAGALAIVLFAAGYLGFSWLERRTHGRSSRLGADLVLPALVAHAFTDGAALAVAFHGSTAEPEAVSWALVAALVVHKVPEGLFIASTLLPAVGARATLQRVAIVAGATIVGGLSGRELLAHTSDAALHALVAAGLGIMLRVIVHKHGAPSAPPRAGLVSGTCFLASLTLAIVVPSPQGVLSRDPHRELSLLTALLSLALTTAPYVLGALVVTVAVRSLVARSLRRSGEGEPERAAVPPSTRERVLGLLLVTAAAECSVPALAVSACLLGPAFTTTRVAPALLAIVGCVPFAIARRRTVVLVEGLLPRPAITLRSLAVGFGAAATVEALTPADMLAPLGPGSVEIALATGALFGRGATVSAPLAAMLVHKGSPVAAALAFSLGAAWCSVPVYRRLRAIETRRVARVASASALAVTLVYAWMLAPWLARHGPAPFHELASAERGPVEWASAAMLVAWAIVHVVRGGPREWLSAHAGEGAGKPVPA